MRYIAATAALLTLPLAAMAQNASAEKPVEKLQTPNEIVAAAQASDWVTIAPDDLLVMDLAPDAKGKTRRVIIQLIPEFSEGWVGNIRTLAKAHWYDGLAIVRVQDNYVVQWGDPEVEDKAKAKPLPKGLSTMFEYNYFQRFSWEYGLPLYKPKISDSYVKEVGFWKGFPFAFDPKEFAVWPIHCYGMVGVGRNGSPDTGTGAELYAVIGHAPRQLDRNIALVGRVISGIEHMTTLPRGTEALGFYKTAEERVPILSIRLASELPAAEQPQFEYLSTESASFAAYVNKRANRKDDFYILPAGGVDICNVPVPIREKKVV